MIEFADENSDVAVRGAVPSVPMKANARIVVSKEGKNKVLPDELFA